MTQRIRSFAVFTTMAAFALAALAACNVVPPGADAPPSQLYSLNPQTEFSETVRPVKWQLAIEMPLADSGLNTQRIALSRQPLQLEYYERANWIDTAPRMLQSLIVESFENIGKAAAVASASAAIRADNTLRTTLRKLYPKARRPPRTSGSASSWWPCPSAPSSPAPPWKKPPWLVPAPSPTWSPPSIRPWGASSTVW